MKIVLLIKTFKTSFLNNETTIDWKKLKKNRKCQFCSQFHQRYMYEFFVRTSFFYVHVTRESCRNDVRTKNSYVERWWNWRLVCFHNLQSKYLAGQVVSNREPNLYELKCFEKHWSDWWKKRDFESDNSFEIIDVKQISIFSKVSRIL